jgi:hypothetical protein
MITEIDFDKDFLNNGENFDGYIIKTYRNNKALWVHIQETYLNQTLDNKKIYNAYLKEYNERILLLEKGISIYSKSDSIGELMKNMATIINEQRNLYANFLHHINHINSNLGKFDTKSVSTIRSRRSRKMKN